MYKSTKKNQLLRYIFKCTHESLKFLKNTNALFDWSVKVVGGKIFYANNFQTIETIENSLKTLSDDISCYSCHKLSNENN